jgi:hypothetical protein
MNTPEGAMATRKTAVTPGRFSHEKFNRLLGDKQSWIFAGEVKAATGREINPRTIDNHRTGATSPDYDIVCDYARTLGIQLHDLGE